MGQEIKMGRLQDIEDEKLKAAVIRELEKREKRRKRLSIDTPFFSKYQDFNQYTCVLVEVGYIPLQLPVWASKVYLFSRPF